MTLETNDGGSASWTGGGTVALEAYAPGVLASFSELVSVRPLGVHDEMLESPAVRAFADQFGVDAAHVDPSVLAGFLAETGERSGDVARMVWIGDVAPRLRAVLDALFGPTAEWPGRRRLPVSDTAAVVEVFLAAVGHAAAGRPDAAAAQADAAQVALTLTGTMTGAPATVPDSVVEAVHEQLAPGVAVAVVLDAARRSAAKIDAALGALAA